MAEAENIQYQHYSAGTYRQNSVMIRFDSLYDLDPEYGDVNTRIIAIHAHEYIHYLHNITTSCGLGYLLCNMYFFKFMIAGCDKNGHYLGEDKTLKKYHDVLCEINKTMNYILGTTSSININKCKNHKFLSYGSPQCLKSDTGFKVVKTIVSVNCNGKTHQEEIFIGLSFITEGIAYEVEREINKNNGIPECELDMETPLFPYLCYRRFIEDISGINDIKSTDLIKIGVASLMSVESGALLVDICNEWKKNPNEDINKIIDELVAIYKTKTDDILERYSDLDDGLNESDIVYKSLVEYRKMVRIGAGQRKTNTYLELDFINGSLTKEELLNIMTQIIDCSISQEKPDNKLHQYWIGGGKIADNTDNIQSISILQAIIHFSQLHMTKTGIPVKTANIKNTRCPFSGVCEDESNSQYPKECLGTPWMRYINAKKSSKICWYACAVKALKKPKG